MSQTTKIRQRKIVGINFAPIMATYFKIFLVEKIKKLAWFSYSFLLYFLTVLLSSNIQNWITWIHSICSQKTDHGSQEISFLALNTQCCQNIKTFLYQRFCGRNSELSHKKKQTGKQSVLVRNYNPNTLAYFGLSLGCKCIFFHGHFGHWKPHSQMITLL